MAYKNSHLPANETFDTERIKDAVYATQEHYRNATAAYAEQLHRFESDIATYRHRIDKKRSHLQEEEKKLQKLDTEIEVHTRMVERINRDIHAKIDLIVSMKHTLANESPEAFARFYRQERERLAMMTDEAETMEIELLELELNRLNLLDEIMPLRHDIERLEHELHRLETEKNAFQNGALHTLPQLAISSSSVQQEGNAAAEEAIIDTDTAE